MATRASPEKEEGESSEDFMATRTRPKGDSSEHFMTTRKKGKGDSSEHFMTTRTKGNGDSSEHFMTTRTKGDSSEQIMTTRTKGDSSEQIMTTRTKGNGDSSEHFMTTRTKGKGDSSEHYIETRPSLEKEGDDSRHFITSAQKRKGDRIRPFMTNGTSAEKQEGDNNVRPRATRASASSEKREGDASSGNFECNICFEQAKDAVVSLCGHLFCWPCIHTWMEKKPHNPTCPVCKSVIERDKCIPLYGRGANDKVDPRNKAPPRPQGQREEPAPHNEAGMDGIQFSFGIGAFPFAMMGGPMFEMFGNRPRGQQQPADPQLQEQQQRLAAIFATIAILVLVLIIFS